MAQYTAYPDSLQEVAVKGFKRWRIFFAISMADKPAWLSWYVFEGNIFDNALQAFSGTDKVDDIKHWGDNESFPSHTFFSFHPQINVNAFANVHYRGGNFSSSPGRCAVTQTRPEVYTCSLSFHNKVGALHLNLLIRVQEGHNPFKLLGNVTYLSTIDLKNAGPLSSVLLDGPPASFQNATMI
jgi:hypothetical protein